MPDLGPYNAKRRFMQTPEPYGEIGVSDPDNLRFVVQQHFATREHFDLRLEIDGVLRSWAVPEGPSVNTKDKRFAIATEDHPLEYAEFEGEIPADEYGGGKIIVWDHGTWVPVTEPVDEALAAGELKFRLAGTKLKGGWTLVKLPKGDKEWLLIKERDPAVSSLDILAASPGSVLKPKKRKLPGRKAPMPTKISPQLATSQPAPPEGDDWLHEIKHDGYRTLITIDDGAVRAITRNGHDWTDKYRSVVAAATTLDCANAILDGEIVVQDGRGKSFFSLLQRALADHRDDALLYFAFDLLYVNGRDLTGEALTVRKGLLRRLAPSDTQSRIQFSDHTNGSGREMFAQVCRLGLEGVVSKRISAAYQMRRSPDWVKAKRYDVGRFTVVGFTTKASSRHVASLMLAEENSQSYVGRASSGLTNDWAAELFASLSTLASPEPTLDITAPKNAVWLRPSKVTAEITYRGRTERGAVRQASILSVDHAAPISERAAPKRKLMTDRDLAAVRLTNPDREVFVGSGTSKLDIALYYARVGDLMLPHILNRPVTLIRCTTGKIEDCFYQRHAMQGLPEGVEAIKDTKAKEFLVIRNARGLLGLTQFGAIEFHPWDCPADKLGHPDRLTIDLDPDEELDWATVAAAAFQIRDRLAQRSLTAFVRSTGGKGLHLVVPLTGRQAWTPVRAYLKGLAKALAADAPGLFVTSSLKSHRVGRIFVDMGRTSRGSSATASYSLRADPEFPAAVPLDWTELQHFTNRPVYNRKSTIIHVEKAGEDPWHDYEQARSAISKSARHDVGLTG